MSTTSTPQVSRLDTAECWRLLEGERFGRLALVGDGGLPDIFPVNFIAHEGAVYMRTAPDVKVARITAHPLAAFEVDGTDEVTQWSVVLRGAASRVLDEVEIARSGVTRLVTWSPRQKPYVIKVNASTVTGRRFARTAEYTPPLHERTHRDGTPTQARLVAPREDEAGPHRAGRPDPIPAVRPH
ncbi:MAG: pyridoxamine 5'-phosphate oxidase family protein [Microbacterium sp.]|uniref:pyridoxamine 5'-phosphate oxidase family protein n=1 Tax=Microbacterium sp. TaxID=51671 RepID=UPI003F81DB6E